MKKIDKPMIEDRFLDLECVCKYYHIFELNFLFVDFVGLFTSHDFSLYSSPKHINHLLEGGPGIEILMD